VNPEGYVSQANESMETQVAIITPNYFQTMQIPIVKGRDFTLQDTKSAQAGGHGQRNLCESLLAESRSARQAAQLDLTHDGSPWSAWRGTAK